MVRVLANVIEVVVFPSSSDTLLRVDGTLEFGHFATGLNCALKNGFELRRWRERGVGKEGRGEGERGEEGGRGERERDEEEGKRDGQVEGN